MQYSKISQISKRRRLQMTRLLHDMGINNEITLNAINDVPRHLFIPSALQNSAYENVSLPIGYNQTISQPYIVAKMTQLLIENNDASTMHILELGTGSGYQTAILANCVAKVYSIERIAGLLQTARNLLYDLKFKNVECYLGDGHHGWPNQLNDGDASDQIEFDGIIAAAAIENIPQAFYQQLKKGGKIVFPHALENGQQVLKVIQREDNEFIEKNIETVNFVPFLKGLRK